MAYLVFSGTLNHNSVNHLYSCSCKWSAEIAVAICIMFYSSTVFWCLGVWSTVIITVSGMFTNHVSGPYSIVHCVSGHVQTATCQLYDLWSLLCMPVFLYSIYVKFTGQGQSKFTVIMRQDNATVANNGHEFLQL